MAIEITMPQLSDTMSEGKILRWLKNTGDTVKRGDALAEVQTDKADLEIEAFHEGVLLSISAPAGETVRVGSIIASIGTPGEQVTPVVEKVAAIAPPLQSVPPPTAVPQHIIPGGESDRTKISPLARNVARSYGVDLNQLSGSGEGGRIIKRDVERYLGRELPLEGEFQVIEGHLGKEVSREKEEMPVSRDEAQAIPAPRPPSATTAGGVSTEPLSAMRQTIARRMVESVTTIPHFYVTAKVLVDQLTKVKDSLKTLPQYQGITYNHLMIKACALASRTVPGVNAHYDNGNLVQPKDINIGIVTAVEGGLLIPVVKQADTLHLAEIVSEARTLVQRARSGRPKSDDLVGGTFSISNMGMFAVDSFTAIINPGQGAILAVSSIQDEVVAIEGTIRPGKVVRLTLSVDHRIIDGVMAGEFLTELKRLLEDPVLLLAA